MIYLKTYFYVEHEFQFLSLNLKQAYNHIDKFIICEFNRTHTGMPRDFIGKDTLFKHLPTDKLDKVLYLPIDISDYSVEAYNNEELIHQINEPVMRSIFMKFLDLKDDDIVVSVDADEIIYENTYPRILKFLETKPACSLNLHQFFYKKNYLWKNVDFIAPVAAKFYHFKNSFPCNLRYGEPVLSEKAGCHFSWCMSVDEMIYKLHTYSHPRYRFCADKELLEDAIFNKKYPFDLSVKFDIEVVDYKSSILLPLGIEYE